MILWHKNGYIRQNDDSFMFDCNVDAVFHNSVVVIVVVYDNQ